MKTRQVFLAVDRTGAIYRWGCGCLEVLRPAADAGLEVQELIERRAQRACPTCSTLPRAVEAPCPS